MSKVYVNGKDEPVEGRFEFSVSVDESKKPSVFSIEGRFVSDAGYSGKTHLRAKRSVEITMPLWYNDIHGTLSPVDAALLRLPHPNPELTRQSSYGAPVTAQSTMNKTT